MEGEDTAAAAAAGPVSPQADASSASEGGGGGSGFSRRSQQAARTRSECDELREESLACLARSNGSTSTCQWYIADYKACVEFHRRTKR